VQIKKRDAEKVFRKLGVEPRTSTHHVAGVARVDGVLTVPLYYSNGRGAMPGKVSHYFRRSLLLSVPEFERLVRCTMSRSEWASLASERLRGGGQ